MVVIIALLHCLPPILGALIGGREGLATGTIIGVICAFVFGAFVFTIPDLLGVGLGFVIGKALKLSLNRCSSDGLPLLTA